MITSRTTPLPTVQNIRPTSLAVRMGLALINLLTAGAVVYGVATLIYLMMRLIVGERWQIVTFTNSLMPALLIPSLPLWMIVALVRRWRVWALLAPSTTAFLVLYGGMFLPISLRQTTPIPDDAPALTIMTWNMHRMIEESEFETALEVIRASNADIIALQEFTQPTEDYLTPRLSDIYPYNALHPYAVSVNGVGLYSRYPIEQDEYWVRRLGNMWARIQFADQQILVYNVHPASPGLSVNTRDRSLEVTEIIERVEAESLPLILVGDFNLTDQSDDYARITSLLHDSFREVGQGLGLTFPNLGYSNPLLNALPPVIRIDYIFHSDHWSALEARVNETSGGSDHYPVIARLALVDPVLVSDS